MPNTFIRDETLRHHEQFVAVCEAWIVHRDDCSVVAHSDPAQLPWRACVRTSDGTLHWEWCSTQERAMAWINRWKQPSAVSAVTSGVGDEAVRQGEEE